MAHWKKFKLGDSKRIMREAFRECDSKSEFYDKEKSKRNVYLWNYQKATERLNKRLEDIPKRKKDTVILMNEVITLPKQVRKEDQRKFFNTVIHFDAEKLGAENLIFACVHNDELTPHLHIAFTPIKEGKWNCKQIMNRNFLKSYHKELQERINQVFDYDIMIERSDLEKELDPRLEFKKYKANRKIEEYQEHNNIRIRRPE